MYFLVVLLLVSLKGFVKISHANGEICKKKFHDNCNTLIVAINDTLIIDTDNGTFILSKRKNGITSTEIRNKNNKKNKIARSSVCKDVHIRGRLEVIGKKVISIRSSCGDIIINSIHPVEVFCSVYANHSNPCNDSNNRDIADIAIANGDKDGFPLCRTIEIDAQVDELNKRFNDTSNDVEDILSQVSESVFKLIGLILGNGVSNYKRNATKIDIEVRTDSNHSIDSKLKKIITTEFVEIPFETIAETGNLTVFTARIKDIQIYRNRTKEKKHYIILASDIVLVQVFINRKPLNDLKNKTAVIKIPNFNKTHALKKQQQIYKKEPKCFYLDNETKLWSSHDVNYTTQNGNTVNCSTGHFTNFAVFFVKEEQQPSEAHKLALGIISNIGCALSLVGVIITLALYVFLRKDVPVLSEDRNIVHFNLMISLGLVQIAFLSATATTSNKLSCKIVALILHYLFVVSFVWMFIEGIILYLKVIMAFNGENVRMGKFIVLGWVFPAIFVAVFAAFKLDDYTKEDRCFLSAMTSTVWALLGPGAFSVVVNIGIFIAVLRVLSRFGTGDEHKTKTIIALRSFVILTPILGFTWAFAIVVMNNQEVVWQYAFCLCNSFQGFMIFLVFGIGNSEIRAVLKRKIFPPDKWNDIKPKTKCSYDNEEVEMDEKPYNQHVANT